MDAWRWLLFWTGVLIGATLAALANAIAALS